MSGERMPIGYFSVSAARRSPKFTSHEDIGMPSLIAPAESVSLSASDTRIRIDCSFRTLSGFRRSFDRFLAAMLDLMCQQMSYVSMRRLIVSLMWIH